MQPKNKVKQSRVSLKRCWVCLPHANVMCIWINFSWANTNCLYCYNVKYSATMLCYSTQSILTILSKSITINKFQPCWAIYKCIMILRNSDVWYENLGV